MIKEDALSAAGAMLLETRHLRKGYRMGWRKKSHRRVLRDVHMTLQPGESIGVTGDSGAGKTTLGLILTGILPPDGGEIRFRGENLPALPAATRRHMYREIQIVFQHPESSFNPRWSMQRSLAEPFQLMGITPEREKLIAMTAEVALDSAILERRPHQLSGGELQRAAIARAMAMKPAVVVLDEPTGMLDSLTQARIMRLLDLIRKRTGTSFILISHDQALVASFCSRGYQLHDGQLVPEVLDYAVSA